MKHTNATRSARAGRRSAALAALVAGTMALAACGSDSNDTGDGGSTTTAGPKLSATLNGSGSSFQKVLEETAIAAFTQDNSGVTINYPGGGSGKGKSDLASKLVDFAGTDSAVKPEELPNFKGASLLYFPIAGGPVTLSYNLDGVDELKLSATTIAKIFQGTITSWDDAAIKAENSGTDLPSTKIVVAHRSDASGTTSNFTKYLDAAATGTWTLGKGDTVSWPANEQAGNGNAGVAQIVQTTKGAIGYVDFADAKAAKLQMASVKNANGDFVAPSTDAASKALAGAEVADDLTFNPLNAAGAGAYPITAPTWILVYAQQPDKAKGDALKAYLNYILTTGQTLAPSVNYAPLPDALKTKAIAQLDKLQIG